MTVTMDETEEAFAEVQIGSGGAAVLGHSRLDGVSGLEQGQAGIVERIPEGYGDRGDPRKARPALTHKAKLVTSDADRLPYQRFYPKKRKGPAAGRNLRGDLSLVTYPTYTQ